MNRRGGTETEYSVLLAAIIAVTPPAFYTSTNDPQATWFESHNSCNGPKPTTSAITHI